MRIFRNKNIQCQPPKITYLLFTLILILIGNPVWALEKAKPSGIVCLLGPAKWSNSSNISSAAFWSKTEVDGVRLRSGWSRLQPNEARVYDWSYIDSMLALAQSHRKFIGLSVAAGRATPQWVYDKGAESFSFVRKKKGSDNAATALMPLPWDKKFQKEWEIFLSDMGRQYDDDPSFSYVVMAGFGPVVETYFVRTKEDLRKFNAAGGIEKWVESGKSIIDIYARSFPKTPFILTMANPVRSEEGRAALQRVVKYGHKTYPGRFGVMNTALNAESSLSSEINKTISALSKGSPTGFQMIWSTVGRNAHWIKGTLAEALQKAVQLDAHYVEVYRRDVENIQYSTTLKSTRKQLKDNGQ